MAKPYTSVLLCFHEGHTDIFVNGLPLAIVKGEAVEFAKVDPLKATGSRFADVDEMHMEVCNALGYVENDITQAMEAKA
jgi:hypothetical protein